MKRKNYYKLFTDYCKKNDIWFSVYPDGLIDTCTETNYHCDFSCIGIFGTKECYEDLIKQHKKEVKD